jgi:hypothetical protein
MPCQRQLHVDAARRAKVNSSSALIFRLSKPSVLGATGRPAFAPNSKGRRHFTTPRSGPILGLGRVLRGPSGNRYRDTNPRISLNCHVMTDTPQPRHWEQLAKELGAEIGPAKAPPKPAPAPTAPPRRTADAPRSAQRPAADWSQLASELGATPVAPPPRRTEKPAATAALPPAALPPAPATRQTFREEPRRDVPPAPRPPQYRPEPPRPAHFESDEFDEAEEMPRSFVADEIEETIDFADRSTDAEVAASESAEGERTPGRRRRRRRRGRGKSGDRPPAPAREPAPREPAVWDVESRTDDESIDEPGDEPDDVELLSRPSAPAETSEDRGRSEEQGRSRRRRRRRGGRRNGESRESADVRAEESRPDRERTTDHPDETIDDDDFDLRPVGVSEAEHASLDEDDDADLKTNHRGIPTWDEAIGMIIGTNMEARARNPGGSSGSRGRRGQNRGRSHGR